MTASVVEDEGLAPDPESDQPDLDAEAEKSIRERPLFERITFKWSDGDQSILDRCMANADEVVSETFSEVFEVLDRIYGQMRLQARRHSEPVFDVGGRPVWERDERGKIIESVEHLSVHEMADAIVDLQRAKMSAALEVNRLRSQAIFAKRIADDTFDDAWPSSGTQADRTVHANQDARTDRYHAFFRYHVYSHANVLLREVDDLIRRLDGVRYTLTQDRTRF